MGGGMMAREYRDSEMPSLKCSAPLALFRRFIQFGSRTLPLVLNLVVHCRIASQSRCMICINHCLLHSDHRHNRPQQHQYNYVIHHHISSQIRVYLQV